MNPPANNRVLDQSTTSLWYWSHGGKTHGPISLHQLRELAHSGRIGAQTLLWRKGLLTWITARECDGLLSSQAASPDHEPETDATDKVTTAIRKAREEAEMILRRLSTINYRRDVIPDQCCIQIICQESLFWWVLGLGIVPLLICTLSRQDYQLMMFSLFFAVLWGLVFRHTVVRSVASWSWLIGSMLFTGVIGIPGLLTIYRYLMPTAYLQLAESDHGLVSLLGFVLQVGLCEEMCKGVPVLLYVAFHRKQLNPQTALLVGVFSGLGFAAFENVIYSERSAQIATTSATLGAASGVKDAMINVLLRSLSLVFCHAVWAGIVAYFTVRSVTATRGDVSMFFVGLALAATMHGVYDWLTAIQLTFATLVVAFSFLLFYAYVAKLRIGQE